MSWHWFINLVHQEWCLASSLVLLCRWWRFREQEYMCACVCEVRVISHHLFWESEASVGSGPWRWSQCSSLGTRSCPRPRAAPWRYTDVQFPARWIAGCPPPQMREAHWTPSCRWSLPEQKESKQMSCENNAHLETSVWICIVACWPCQSEGS